MGHKKQSPSKIWPMGYIACWFLDWSPRNRPLLIQSFPFQVIFFKRNENLYVYIKTCTKMFTEALFLRAPNWKPPQCPWIGDWINKSWYIHTMKYYLAIKRTSDSGNNMDEYKKHAVSKSSLAKKVHTVWIHLYEV